MQSISLNDSLLPREWINRRIAVKLIFLSNGFSFATIIPHFPWLQRKLEIGDALTGFALLFPASGRQHDAFHRELNPTFRLAED